MWAFTSQSASKPSPNDSSVPCRKFSTTRSASAADPQAATENLREVLERIGKRHVVQITVNPSDAESMRRFAEKFSAASQRLTHTVITEDADMEPGGCRLQLPEGQIDASIDAQLDRIAEALLPGEPRA